MLFKLKKYYYSPTWKRMSDHNVGHKSKKVLSDVFVRQKKKKKKSMLNYKDIY